MYTLARTIWCVACFMLASYGAFINLALIPFILFGIWKGRSDLIHSLYEAREGMEGEGEGEGVAGEMSRNFPFQASSPSTLYVLRQYQLYCYMSVDVGRCCSTIRVSWDILSVIKQLLYAPANNIL